MNCPKNVNDPSFQKIHLKSCFGLPKMALTFDSDELQRTYFCGTCSKITAFRFTLRVRGKLACTKRKSEMSKKIKKMASQVRKCKTNFFLIFDGSGLRRSDSFSELPSRSFNFCKSGGHFFFAFFFSWCASRPFNIFS